MVYALSASYIHWPVVSDHFAPCFDLFPAYFALFLPCMMVKQTFPSEAEEREEEDRRSKGKAGEHRYGRASQNTD